MEKNELLLLLGIVLIVIGLMPLPDIGGYLLNLLLISGGLFLVFAGQFVEGEI